MRDCHCPSTIRYASLEGLGVVEIILVIGRARKRGSEVMFMRVWSISESCSQIVGERV
jgi:hypothetical protein